MFDSQDVVESVKHGVDVLSLGVFVATLAELAQPVAAWLTAVWVLIRIYESRTVQKMLGRDPGA